jgi:hypothetical protein
MAENKTTTKKTEKTYTEKQVDELIKKAVKQALEENQAQTIVQVSKEEYVTVLLITAVADDTSVSIGEIGKINRAGNTLDIEKKTFLQCMGNPVVDTLLRKRKLIVVNGLTDEERERFGLLYEEGELLTQKAYFKLLDFTREEIVSIFEKLCEEHKRVVAKMYMTAYFDKNDNRVNLETVRDLNRLSKSVEKDGLFKTIIDDIGAKLSD